MKLIIVESPTKGRTLTKFLKGAYQVEASFGHIRDLPKSSLGVDVDHDFEPSYIIPTDKKKKMSELKALAEKAEEVILATDPDREGEAIAWHLSEVISNDKKKKKDQIIKRISFHEITESAIKEALAHPGEIDMKLVNAQQGRRVLDRLVGYTLSPLLWKKLSRKWLSAGRVQSVTVRLIVEREKEIEAFAKQPYMTIQGTFEPDLIAELKRKDGVAYEQTIKHNVFDGVYTVSKTTIENEAHANTIIKDLQTPYIVKSVEKKETKRTAPAPYTTSTLQQDAGRKLSFSSKKIMQLAQKLYEEGVITYHRTDSVNLSDKFISESRAYIETTFGKEYLPAAPKKYDTKSKVAQEAHEAIRPTDASRAEIDINGEMSIDHKKLYEIIWKRAVGCQMADAKFASTTIRIHSANAYEFETQGSVIIFDGFLKIIGKENGDVILPNLTEGQTIACAKTEVVPHTTTPPPRYTEASLIKTLEEKDIGRPSTYAPTISTVIDRQYVTKDDKKIIPTELGFLVTNFLVTYFKNIVELPFTATIENQLDAIAKGETEWKPVIETFYKPFIEQVKKAEELAIKVKMPEEETNELCPQCNNPLVVKTGKFGKFIACSDFPTCKFTKPIIETIDINCPLCGNPIAVKKTKYGKVFFGCSTYPACTFAAWKKEDIKPVESSEVKPTTTNPTTTVAV